MDSHLVTQALNFHGQQLMKVWEAQGNYDELQKLNLKNVDYHTYHQRSKELSFQERTKRLKVHQFVVKKANMLFKPLSADEKSCQKALAGDDDDHFAIMPPYEAFLDVDKIERKNNFYKYVQEGDMLICSLSNKQASGMMLRVICFDGGKSRALGDMHIRAFCPASQTIPAQDKRDPNRSYMQNDLLRCEVLEVQPDAEKLIVGMKGVNMSPELQAQYKLGLISRDDLPASFKKYQEMGKDENYESCLENTIGFNNPNNTSLLSDMIGLSSKSHSLMVGLRGHFPKVESAAELRQLQSSKWAFNGVAEGIKYYKTSNYAEAFQCLNRALTIDPKNVEGLVARGALYANSGSYEKAVDDFELSLSYNPSHVNARKYLAETLTAYGKHLEGEGKITEALSTYERCLKVVPEHLDAREAMQLSSIKMGDSKNSEAKDRLKHFLHEDSDDKKKKKEKKRRKKRRYSSSTSSSSSSSSTGSSSDSNSSARSSSASPDAAEKRKKKHKEGHKREASLSPFSKRMMMLDGSQTMVPSNPQDPSLQYLDGSANRSSWDNQNPPAPQMVPPPQVPNVYYNQPLTANPPPASDPVYPGYGARAYEGFSNQPAAAIPAYGSQKYDPETADYDEQVRRFLATNSEYEEKVKRFLEVTQGKKDVKKDKKQHEKESKKKKKKDRRKKSKDKKKKEEKKHKKSKDKKSKNRGSSSSSSDSEEESVTSSKKKSKKKGLAGIPGLELLPDLGELEAKLSAYYAKIESDKTPKQELSRDDPYGKWERRKDSTEDGRFSKFSDSLGMSAKKGASPKVMYVHNPKFEESLGLKEKDKFDDDFAVPSKEASHLGNKWKVIGEANSNRSDEKRDLFDRKEEDEEFDKLRQLKAKWNDKNKGFNEWEQEAAKPQSKLDSSKIFDDGFRKMDLKKPNDSDEEGEIRSLERDANKPKIQIGPLKSKFGPRRPRSPGERSTSPTDSKSHSRSSSVDQRNRRSGSQPRRRSRSYSYSRSRSRSPRRRSRSYSRSSSSRSRSYRSRSGSRDRRHHHHMNRGRFQNRNYVQRGRSRGRYQRNFRRGRGFYPRNYNNRGGYRGNYHNNRDNRYYNNRRYDHRRSYSVSPRRSDREEDDRMRQVQEAKRKIDREIGKSTPNNSDDDNGRSSYPDDKAYGGRWADEDKKDSKAKIPDDNLEEMEEFLNNVSQQKKEEMKERNKEFLKST